jgi:hypothetical protein
VAVFISQFLELDDGLEKLGIFDALIDEDSNYFINIIRLKSAKTKEFQGSYEKINDYFRKIGVLLKASKRTDDKFYKSALKLFNFPEVNGINLGFSKGGKGAGFGKVLRNQIIKDAVEIIKTGSDYPEIFHLTSLFEENVGPDRLSDMIARLVYDEIIIYTKNMYQKLGVSQENYPKLHFKNGIPINPYRNCELLLLPIDILHELPIASDWEDIDRVVQENEIIRSEINELVGDEWSKLSSGARKDYIKKYIFKKPNVLSKVINIYREKELGPYNIYKNTDYLIDSCIYKLMEFENINVSHQDSYIASKEIISSFKNWIENNKGYMVFENVNSRNEEKVYQRILHGHMIYFCKANNFDISPESDTGRGPVDFKISRGNDKTVIEIKLSSNKDMLHGYNVQIEEYAKSENTEKKIFIGINNEKGDYRIKQVLDSKLRRTENGENPAEVIIIDSIPKDSASNYRPKVEG